MKTLMILNDAPYGGERTYNGLRLAGSIARKGAELRVFLNGDAVACAKTGQKVPSGYYNTQNMLRAVIRHGYVLNSPRMHLWHHDQSSEGGAAKNFGIVFSVWDFLFGTAYWPRQRSPERLGYPGMQEMPVTFHGQILWPATRHPGSPVAGPEASFQ